MKIKKITRGACIGLSILFSGLILYYLWPRLHPTPTSRPTLLAIDPTSSPSSLPSPSNTLPNTPTLRQKTSRTPSSEAQQKAWAQFANQFGSHLRPQFSEEGYLRSILSRPHDQPADKTQFLENFDPKNSIQGLKRAKEILEAAQDLLQIQPDWPLENATIQNGPLSCQIYWTETHDGLPVLPGGTIKIDLGSKGELLELQSTYLHSLQVVNQVHLTQDEAESRIPGSGPIYGGNLMIWNIGNNQGHLAYQMSRNGRQIILDADTGRILMNRDRRQF